MYRRVSSQYVWSRSLSKLLHLVLRIAYQHTSLNFSLLSLLHGSRSQSVAGLTASAAPFFSREENPLPEHGTRAGLPLFETPKDATLKHANKFNRCHPQPYRPTPGRPSPSLSQSNSPLHQSHSQSTNFTTSNPLRQTHSINPKAPSPLHLLENTQTAHPDYPIAPNPKDWYASHVGIQNRIMDLVRCSPFRGCQQIVRIPDPCNFWLCKD